MGADSAVCGPFPRGHLLCPVGRGVPARKVFVFLSFSRYLPPPMGRTNNHAALEKSGSSATYPYRYKGLLRKTGFRRVHVRKYAVPTNGWPNSRSLRRIGDMQATNFLSVVDILSRDKFVHVLGWTSQEADALIAQVRHEVQENNLHAFYTLYSRPCSPSCPILSWGVPDMKQPDGIRPEAGLGGMAYYREGCGWSVVTGDSRSLGKHGRNPFCPGLHSMSLSSLDATHTHRLAYSSFHGVLCCGRLPIFPQGRPPTVSKCKGSLSCCPDPVRRIRYLHSHIPSLALSLSAQFS